LALKAAVMNPRLVPWIWEQAGTRDFIRWIGSYLWFAVESMIAWCLRGWFPGWLVRSQAWLESRYPALWLHCLSLSLRINSGLGRSPHITRLPKQPPTRQEVSVG
jgi:lycopene cyclase CruA